MADSTLLAVSLIDAQPPLAQQLNAAIQAGAEIVELRVDRIGDDQQVAALLREPRSVPLILTIRSQSQGGAWSASDSARVALLRRLASLRPDWVDVELSDWNEVKLTGNTAAQAIVSHHDLKHTPDDLDGLLTTLAQTGAGVLKLAVTARDSTDALRAVAALRASKAQQPAIVLAMGDAGIASRILARKFGAFLTFAALTPDRASAPGQPTIADLLDVYRWRSIGPATRVYGVVGWPITHSSSPQIHNAVLAADDCDAVYLPFPVAPDYESFRTFMDFLDANGWLDVMGLSITIPHKGHALHWLHATGGTISSTAQRCGAVNTLSRDAKSKWQGDNTDVTGFAGALRTVIDFPGSVPRQAEVLGAGGVASAVVCALCEGGWHVTVANRTEARARDLAERFRCEWIPWSQRGTAGVDLVVNCTSVGMAPEISDSPLESRQIQTGALVVDTIYNPAQTSFLQDAAARGCRTLGGVEMFVQQAGEQYRLWHDRTCPVEILRDVMSRID